jgi:hypothetical protein
MRAGVIRWGREGRKIGYSARKRGTFRFVGDAMPTILRYPIAVV